MGDVVQSGEFSPSLPRPVNNRTTGQSAEEGVDSLDGLGAVLNKSDDLQKRLRALLQVCMRNDRKYFSVLHVGRDAPLNHCNMSNLLIPMTLLKLETRLKLLSLNWGREYCALIQATDDFFKPDDDAAYDGSGPTTDAWQAVATDSFEGESWQNDQVVVARANVAPQRRSYHQKPTLEAVREVSPPLAQFC